MIPMVAVGGVVIVPGPRVLLVRRATPPMEGAWTLPGGRLEGGESIAHAVEREVFEETGVRVVAGDLVEVVELVREGHHYVIHDHLCTPVDPGAAPRPGDDVLEARYVLPSELGGLAVTEAVSRVIMRAMSMRQSCLEDE